MATSTGSALGGGSWDDLRRANLAAVLRLVREGGPTSRSELTKATGLNRSTVGTIVSELVSRGLVATSETTKASGVGRPSLVVSVTDRAVAFAVHPEVDSITVAAVSLGGTVLRSVRLENERVPSAREAANASIAIIESMRPGLEERHLIVGAGVAIPGLVSRDSGLVALAPHLGWVDQQFTTQIEQATGLATTAWNDASCAAVAESLFGVGKGSSDIVFLNGGASGIGGGVVSGGLPLLGVSGFAGEFGHMLVNPNGHQCHCGMIGCLQTEVRRSELLEVSELTSAPAEMLSAELESRYASSPRVRAVVDRQVDYLAIALRNVTNILNPEIVILGGFLGALHSLDSSKLSTVVARTALHGSGEIVRIAQPGLHANSLLIGAAELAFGPVLTDPTVVPELEDPGPLSNLA